MYMNRHFNNLTIKPFQLFSPLILISLLVGITVGCNHNRQVVPVEIDADEVYKPLVANDEDVPALISFGRDSIPGFIFDYEMSSDDPDIFIYYQNLTVLDINPSITQDILDFSLKELSEHGFITDSIFLNENVYKDLLSEGLYYKEAVTKIIDEEKDSFDSRFSTLESYSSAFNIYFKIYPVYLDDKYITYRLYSYCFTGGAHGITVSYLRTYDLATGKLQTLEDLIKPERITDLREEVAAQMAYAYPIYEDISTVDQYIDSLNVWLDNFDTQEEKDDITLKNFPLPDPALTNEGLAFVYQMYELTPGSDGCPLVVIPYKDIAKWRL